MSHEFGASGSSSAAAGRFRSDHLHVAQQSRRDKLRVQPYQFVSLSDDGPNPSISSMLASTPGILDFAAGGDPSSSCDWIVNQINGGSHPLFLQSHLYRLPGNAADVCGQETYHHALTSSLGLESAAHELAPWADEPRQLKAEGPGFSHGLSLSLASSKPDGQFDHHHHDAVLSSCPDPRRSLGPLGPFTGYAAILKSSRFLRPAQQLLDEFCSVAAGYSKFARRDEGSCRAVMGGGSSLYCSTAGTDSGYESGGGAGGAGVGASCSNVSQQQPAEMQQKKVKLLFLHEEVCRRYKQYHQQMQMVVSSFESVAGLSAATPYTSLALKAVSKQFRSAKHAISNQLRYVSSLLGEDFVSSPSSSSRGEAMATTPRPKYIDQGLRKQKACDNASVGFLDNNQPVWRPQRGLPERAVSVLRGWLFEHFLHPYPSDTDKHMLATQTGLTRNQVSNWFINARVRLWKPMVEEIHMLESKGMAEMDLNSSNRNDDKSIMDDGGRQCSLVQGSEQSNKQLGCSSSMDAVANESGLIGSMEQWHREKRLRMDACAAVPGGLDGGLMTFAYQGGMDIGGLGAVSLTLGLRHNEDEQQQQQQQMRHFGGQMFHDFVG